MLKKLLLALLLAPLTLVAQKYDMRNYDWEKETPFQALEESEMGESSVILKDKRVFEYMVEEEGLVTYETRHKIIRVNDDKGIENYNKFFLPLYNVIEVVEIKARTISKEGKVINLDESNMKELENVEDYGFFKIFAIDGLEPESTFEVLYTIKKGGSIYGRQTFQGQSIIKDASIEIITPKHLTFKAKSYNGFPEIFEETEDDKRYLRADTNYIPILEDEKYSTIDAHLMRVEYKFSNNIQQGSGEGYTWSDGAKRYYEIIYGPLEKYEKKFAKELGKLKLDGKTDVEKVKAIEIHLKNNYTFQENNPKGSDLGEVFKAHIVDKYGASLMTAGMLLAADIKHEFVLTTDRYDIKFDKEFQSWNFLDEYLFYFPDTKYYLAPDKFASRLGMFPFQYANNYGLFIRRLEVGEMTTGLGEVKWIDCCAANDNADNLDMKISFPDEMSVAKVNVVRTYKGHSAMHIQPYYELFDPSDQESVLDDLLKFMGDDAELTSKTIKNTDKDISPLELPLIMEGEMEVGSLLEKAGPNYLFKIGQVIGPQAEMYQEKERKTDVEMQYPHIYFRTIQFTVPDGFTVTGMDALNIDIKYKDDDGESMGFVSTFTQEGNVVTVNVEEYYNRFNYPMAQFEDFRKVINAAADFNKIVLVFEKGN